jgi:hypothetical protein
VDRRDLGRDRQADLRLCIPTQWDIRGGSDLRRDTSYLVISNHQSWVDIPALIQASTAARRSSSSS